MTARLLSSVAGGDVNGVARCLSSFIDGTVSYACVAEREKAVAALLSALEAFPRNASIVAGCLGAFAHTLCMEVAIPVAAVLKAVKQHEKNVLVVQAASRLFSLLSLHKLEHLPLVAEAAARWLQLHPNDSSVAYYCALIIVEATGLEPMEVKREHGALGQGDIAVATVKACTATRLVEVQVNGVDWNAYILSHLFPRMR